MRLEDPFASRVVPLGVVVVRPDVVARDGAVVVHVHLAAPDRVELPEHLVPSRRQVARQQHVFLRIVPLRLRERHPVRRIVGQAEAEGVRLNAVVAFPFPPRIPRVDVGQQPAGRISHRHVRIDRKLELVLVPHLHSAQRLPIRLT